MKSVVAILFLLLAGPGFLIMGLVSLRRKLWRDGVPAGELLAHRIFGSEPPSRTAWDQRFSMFNVAMFTIFGTIFSILLAVTLISLVSE